MRLAPLVPFAGALLAGFPVAWAEDPPPAGPAPLYTVATVKLASGNRAPLVFSPDRTRYAVAVRLKDPGRPPGALVVTDDVAGEPYDQVGNPVFSPDGRHVAYSAQKGNDCVVVLDGRAGPRFDAIWAPSLCFSPDGARFAYQAKTAGKAVVVVDGKAGEGCAALKAVDQNHPGAGRSIFFSPDGAHVVYVAQQGGDTVVCDGKAVGTWDDVALDSLCFKAHAAMPMFRATVADKQIVVTDGRSGELRDEILGPAVSGDGARAAYAEKHDGQWHAILDGKPSVNAYDDMPGCGFARGNGPFYFIGASGRHGETEMVAGQKEVLVVEGKASQQYDVITVLPAPAGHLAYLGMLDGKTSLVVDGEAGDRYDGIERTVLWSPDGRSVACVATQGKQKLVVRDGKAGPAYKGVANLVYSPDGGRFAYAAQKDDGRWVAVVDDAEGAACDGLDHDDGEVIAFSADGRHVAYRAADQGRHVLVSDGVRSAPYDRVTRPVASADGAHTAFVATQGGRQVLVTDGIEGLTADVLVNPVFSADGAHLACTTGKVHRKLVVDGQESAAVDEVVGPYRFADDGTFSALVVEGMALERLTFTPLAPAKPR
jgi:Tol biopolymer transport system component